MGCSSSLRAVFIIICEYQSVVKYIDGIQKNINNLPLIFLIVRVSMFKPADPFNNVLPAVFRAL